MLKFFQKINIENFKKIIIGVFKRMPLSMLISMVIFVLIVILVRFDDMNYMLKNNLNKAVFTLILSFFFSVGIYLYSESKNTSKIISNFYQIVTFVFGLLFYYFFEENLFTNPEQEVIVYCILTAIGVIAFVFISPFISKLKEKTLSQKEFYITSYTLIIKILMSAIVGLAVMLLGFIAFSAIFTLFDINFVDNNNCYAYWAAFSFSLFASIFFLANLPFIKKDELLDLQKIQNNKFYSFLINYIGLPAIFIYFLILYAYTAKVLIHFSEWPQGEIAWLVILFSFFGYIIYFATYAFVDTLKQAKIFRKFLPIVVFLQTFMLFYAIGLRINQYDITINRYLVLVFGFWLFGLSLYYIISKKKNLSVPFYSLLIIIIFISIGPWSVYVVPRQRQQNNLEINLKKANILQNDGSIRLLESYQDISEELSGEIYGSIDYLCNHHGCDTLNKYFSLEIAEIKKEDREKFKENKKKELEQAEINNNQNNKYIESIKKREYRPIHNWTLINELTKKIKVKKYYKNKQDNNFINFNFRNNNYVGESINVSGYDYFSQVYSQKFEYKIEKDLSDMYYVVLNVPSQKLELYLGTTTVETFNIKDKIIKTLLDKKDDSLEYKDNNRTDILLSNKDMSFEFTGILYDLRLVLRNISIRNPEWKDGNNKKHDNNKIEEFMLRNLNVNGYALIKNKININK